MLPMRILIHDLRLRPIGLYDDAGAFVFAFKS